MCQTWSEQNITEQNITEQNITNSYSWKDVKNMRVFWCLDIMMCHSYNWHKHLPLGFVCGYVGFVPEKSNGFRHLQTQQLHLQTGCQQSAGSDVCSPAARWIIRNCRICLWLGRVGSPGWWYPSGGRSHSQNAAGGCGSLGTGTDPLDIRFNPFYITFVPERQTNADWQLPADPGWWNAGTRTAC